MGGRRRFPIHVIPNGWAVWGHASDQGNFPQAWYLQKESGTDSKNKLSLIFWNMLIFSDGEIVSHWFSPLFFFFGCSALTPQITSSSRLAWKCLSFLLSTCDHYDSASHGICTISIMANHPNETTILIGVDVSGTFRHSGKVTYISGWKTFIDFWW